MSDNVPYADIVILALIAGFILLRLRGVLGQKPDGDGNDFFRRDLPVAQKLAEPIVQVNEKSLKPKAKEEIDPYLATIDDSAIVDALNAIKLKDPQFTATSFISGARAAFEMVFDAFAKGDVQTLKMLLSDARFAEFKAEIDARANEETRSETTLVSVAVKNIGHAELDKNTARISINFTSEQVTVVRDAQGKIVEGDASQVHEVDSDWVFERDTTSKNPNWKIIET